VQRLPEDGGSWSEFAIRFLVPLSRARLLSSHSRFQVLVRCLRNQPVMFSFRHRARAASSCCGVYLSGTFTYLSPSFVARC
jgi:hypothetical protein